MSIVRRFLAAALIALPALAQSVRFTPIVMDKTLPEVPACRGILNQSIADSVRASTEDPGKSFEKWRHDHRNMMEAPPVVDCKSKLWKAIYNGTNVATVPPDTEWLTLRSPNPGNDLFPRSLSASLGANLTLAAGVAEYQGETNIAVNPNNPLQLIASANTYYRDPDPGCNSPTGGAAQTYGTMALYGSSDGGATWIHRCAPWPASLTGSVQNATQYYGSDPAVAWDSQGRAVTVYMLISAADNGNSGVALVCYRSSDVGNSWSYLGTIVNHISNTKIFDDKQLIAIDNSAGPASTKSHPGRIYVIWDASNSERVAFSDDGATWTTVVLPQPSFGVDDVGADIKVGADGTVYTIWNRLSGPSNQTGEATVFSKSVDGGNTWSAPVTVATQALLSFGTNNYPFVQNERGINAFASLGIDTNPASAYYGRLYVAFTDFPSGTSTGTDLNVYVASSSNGGTTWSPRVKMNDDSGTGSQFFPWLAVDPTDGSVNAAWYDTRNDANAHRAQMYYARSSNGGVSFEPNILLNDSGSGWNNHVDYFDESSLDNLAFNSNQYGDYSGIAAFNRQVHPFWTDSRQFYPAATGTLLEDGGTTTIINCSAPDVISAPVIGTCPVASGIALSWSAPPGWGTNATGGTYSVYRGTSTSFGSASPVVTGLSGTTYSDTTSTGGTTYYYFVKATNNCPGTALTPMSTSSVASAPVTPPAILPAALAVVSAGIPYSVVFSETFGTNPVTFGESGTLPSGLTFTNGTLSGTTTQLGSFPITITATDANNCVTSTPYTLTVLLADGSAPASLVATATSTTQISVSWTGVANTNHYDVTRKSGASVTTLTTAATSLTDTVSAGTTYRYVVRAINNASAVSPFSNYDIATTISFTDDPLIATQTVIKAIHITQLRTAVNAVRAAAGLTAYSFTDPALSGRVKSVHLTELRTALDAARTSLSVPAIVYANPGTVGTKVRAADLTELRNGVK